MREDSGAWEPANPQEETAVYKDVWPRCSVDGCCFRVWLGGVEVSGMCAVHTFGGRVGEHVRSEEEHQRVQERLREFARRGLK